MPKITLFNESGLIYLERHYALRPVATTPDLPHKVTTIWWETLAEFFNELPDTPERTALIDECAPTVESTLAKINDSAEWPTPGVYPHEPWMPFADCECWDCTGRVGCEACYYHFEDHFCPEHDNSF